MVVIGIWVGALIFAIFVAKAGEWSQKIEREEKINNMRERERLERQKKEREDEEQQRYMYEQYEEYKKDILPPRKEKVTECFIEHPLLLELYYKIIKAQEGYDFEVSSFSLHEELREPRIKKVEAILAGYSRDYINECISQELDELCLEWKYYEEKLKEILEKDNRFKILFWDFFLSNEAMTNGVFEVYKSEMFIKYYQVFKFFGIIDNLIYKESKTRGMPETLLKYRSLR